MQVNSTARLRFVSVPPRKMRQVARLLKGMPVQKALDVLSFTPRIAARHIANTVKSAAANALSQEGTDRLRPEDLHIKDIYVDAAPTAKRIRFRSMGRVYRIRKRFCHLTVRLEGEMETEEQVARRRAARGKKAAEQAGGKKAKGKATTAGKKATAKKAKTAESAAEAPQGARKKTGKPASADKKAEAKEATTKQASPAAAEPEPPVEEKAAPDQTTDKPTDEETKE